MVLGDVGCSMVLGDVGLRCFGVEDVLFCLLPVRSIWGKTKTKPCHLQLYSVVCLQAESSLQMGHTVAQGIKALTNKPQALGEGGKGSLSLSSEPTRAS